MPEEEVKTEETKEEPNILEEAKKLRDENLKVLEEMKKERTKLEKLQADLMISGRSLGGQKPQKREETPREYKDRVMRGEI